MKSREWRSREESGAGAGFADLQSKARDSNFILGTIEKSAESSKQGKDVLYLISWKFNSGFPQEHKDRKASLEAEDPLETRAGAGERGLGPNNDAGEIRALAIHSREPRGFTDRLDFTWRKDQICPLGLSGKEWAGQIEIQ